METRKKQTRLLTHDSADMNQLSPVLSIDHGSSAVDEPDSVQSETIHDQSCVCNVTETSHIDNRVLIV